MKNDNLYWLMGIAGFILLIFISAFISNANVNLSKESLFNEMSVTDYLSIIENDDLAYIYVGSSSCPVCQQIEPLLEDIMVDMGIAINYLNIASFSQTDYEMFIASHDLLQDDWGTPLLLVFNKGELQDHLIGFRDYDTLKEFYLDNTNK